MKDNLDIEQLFREGLGNLEGQVSPEVWGNIQSGMAANAASTGAAGGMSLLTKVALISGIGAAAVVTTVALWPSEKEEISENIPSTEVVDQQNTPKIILEENTTLQEEGNTIEQTVNFEEVENISEETIGDDARVGSGEDNAELVDGMMTNDSDQSLENTEGARVSSDNTEVASGESEDNSTEKQGIVSGSNNSTEEVSGNTDIEETPNSNVLEANMTYMVIEENKEYAFYSNAENAKKVIWSFGDGNTAEGSAARHMFTKPGSYNVSMKVYGEEGFAPIVSQETIVIESNSFIEAQPRWVFSPNWDQANDQIFVKHENIASFEIRITNAKGELVFKESDPNFKWDGTDLYGNLVENGTYIYFIFAEGEDGVKHHPTGRIEVRR